MWDTIYNLFERISSWPVVALLFALFVLCAQGFELRHKSLGYENATLDSRFWYSPNDARDFFNAIGERGRRIYAITQITLDLVFPFIYASLFAAFIINLYKQDTASKLVFVPLLTMAADLLENFTTACLAWQFDGRASPIARFAAVFTATKTVFLILSFLLILGGAIAGIWRPHKPAV